MEDYKRELLYNGMNLDDYEFLDEEGSFECHYVGRWMNKDDNLVCLFDMDDGRKIRSMAWLNNGYYKLEQIPLGSRVRLEFKRSGSGKNYLRKVVILGGDNYD